MAHVKQSFVGPALGDLEYEVNQQFEQSWLTPEISPGMRIAVAVGSRGIANLSAIVRMVCYEIQALGATPFIIPAMGSHGGATAEGQTAVLRSLGITEKLCGAPIISSMDVVQIGATWNQIPVYMDKQAWNSDGVVLVNRIKPHTDFHSGRGFESGLLKMSVIGLGKDRQAEVLHGYGVKGLVDFLPEVADVVLGTGKVLGGVAIVENAREETAIIEVLHYGQITDREPILLKKAIGLMPGLPVKDLDVLLVDQIGKDFSGTGMDTNIIGRIGILGSQEPKSPRIKYIIASDLTEASHGNALGIGLADFTTRRLFEKIDFDVMNANVLTSSFIRRGMIPLVLDNTKECLQAALRCNWGVSTEKARLIRIPNTLHLEHIYVSEALLPEIRTMPYIEVIQEGIDLEFDHDGYLTPFRGV